MSGNVVRIKQLGARDLRLVFLEGLWASRVGCSSEGDTVVVALPMLPSKESEAPWGDEGAAEVDFWAAAMGIVRARAIERGLLPPTAVPGPNVTVVFRPLTTQRPDFHGAALPYEPRDMAVLLDAVYISGLACVSSSKREPISEVIDTEKETTPSPEALTLELPRPGERAVRSAQGGRCRVYPEASCRERSFSA